jgi:hypothetical protein
VGDGKWTPGPWRFERTDNGVHESDLEAAAIHGSIVGGPRGMILARVWADGGHPAEDAAMLAAATDLYAALESVLVMAEKWANYAEGGDKNRKIVAARSALARARGETP